MRIAIIGGGITGLTSAYKLTAQGHTVTVFEKESFLGGLAYGFKQPNWDWHIEGAYHHLFTNDSHIISLLYELGLKHDLIIKRPVTASLWQGHMYQLDSPVSLFQFPGFTFIDKIRTAMLLGVLKITPIWQPLEGITAEHLITSIGGENAFRIIWKPLLYGKFGAFAPHVAASWFWARIKKRTASLCYIRGGFYTFVETLAQTIIKQGGTIHTGTEVTMIKKYKTSYTVTYDGHGESFDKVLLTIPTPFAYKLLPQIPKTDPRYSALSTVPHLFAQTLILETKEPILRDVYWLNVTDQSFPFLAAVAHTNFVDNKHYGNHHLTYFGNYLPQNHHYLSMSKDQLIKEFMPYIRRLNPALNSKHILNAYVFVGPYAQPVHTIHYSKNIPPIATPIPNIYMANMDYIFPWDRGTNYAVELGIRAAKSLIS
jgi:protoporphyrinogen oxidase